jgi:P27 family predicted phage terminase small subunit
MQGRHPKPSSVLMLEKGKLYGDQKDRAALEPQAKTALQPRCPSRLSKAEKKAWRNYAATLKIFNLFVIANAHYLELLAINQAQFDACTDMVRDEGVVVSGAKGNRMLNPWFLAQQKCQEKITRCLTELGLSSLSAAKIGSALTKKRGGKSGYFEDDLHGQLQLEIFGDDE